MAGWDIAHLFRDLTKGEGQVCSIVKVTVTQPVPFREIGSKKIRNGSMGNIELERISSRAAHQHSHELGKDWRRETVETAAAL
jgi:hypothetical protein